jgi:hypothetical protein
VFLNRELQRKKEMEPCGKKSRVVGTEGFPNG